jgi:hypothetical protein
MLLLYFILILLSLFGVISRYDLFISNPIKNLSNFIDAIADNPIPTKEKYIQDCHHTSDN